MASVKKKPAKTKKPATKKTVAKKPVAKAVAKKPAQKTVAARKPVAKKAAPKKAAATKTIAKKVVAKKTITKKVVAKKPAAKKIAVKKPAAKITAGKITAAPQKPSGPYGIPEQLRDAALKILDERQAEDIVNVPLEGRSAVADYIIIASGRASRQVAAIADYLQDAFYKAGAKNVRIEGKGEGNWVLIDAGDVIVHLFRPEVRAYYDLDAIWSRKAGA
ncbi:MAG: ribosome silencing factor [Alphaproteobacteria bacterium]|nr:ribosome silencing factor [Alphaproteobacteria bacterium]